MRPAAALCRDAVLIATLDRRAGDEYRAAAWAVAVMGVDLFRRPRTLFWGFSRYAFIYRLGFRLASISGRPMSARCTSSAVQKRFEASPNR